MKRKILIPVILMAVMSAFTLSGCNSEEKESEETVSGFDASALPEEKATNEREMWSVLPKIDVTPIDELEYKYSGEYGGVYITGYTGKSYKVRIPEIINDEPVVAVNLKGVDISELIVPDTVEYINVTKKNIKYINYPAGVFVANEKEGYTNLEGLYLCSNYFSSSQVEMCDNPVVMHNGKKYTKDNLSEMDKFLIPYRVDDGCLMNFYDSLSEFEIPSDVTSIADNAFSGCETLTSITIPDSVETIGNNAFTDCTGLTSLTVGSGITGFGKDVFKNCEGVTQLTYNSGVYNDCFPNLESVVIGDEITEITETSFINYKKLTNVTISNGVEIIGGSAFSGCTNLSTINIPDSVIVIGARAFADCTLLKTIDMSNGVVNICNSAFEGCSGLTDIILPDSVKLIGNSAFSNCTSLTTIKVGNGVAEIGKNAFENCEAVKKITYNNNNFIKMLCNSFGKRLQSAFPDLETVIISHGVTEICDSDFQYCSKLTNVTLSDSVTVIGNCAFEGCGGLTDITIPNSVNIIGEYAFSGCTGITNIVIPDNVTGIGNSAFRGCTGLTDITIPDGITKINDYTFSGCTVLTNVTIPNSVTEIGDSSFLHCTSLTDIAIPDSVIEIGSSAFSGCTSLVSVTIPDGVTVIGSSAFKDCTGLTDINIPIGVTKIEDNTFSGCVYLKDIVIPDGIVAIGNKAFYGCTELANIVIPKEVTEVGDYAFSGCTKATDIIIPDDVKTIGEYTFSNCTGVINITIGKGIKTFGDKVFNNCSNTNMLICNSYVIGHTPLSNSYNIEPIEVSNCFPNLETVIIGDKISVIGANAFENCKKLTNITMTDSVTEIHNQAFFGCTELKEIILPSNITYIGKYAFKDCSNLTKIEASAIVWDKINSNRSFYGLSESDNLVIAENSAEDNVDYSDTVSFSCGDNVYFSYPTALLQNTFDLDIYLEYHRLASATYNDSGLVYKEVGKKGTCVHQDGNILMMNGLGLSVWARHTNNVKYELKDVDDIRYFNLGELKSKNGNTLNRYYSRLGKLVSQEDNETYARNVWEIADVADNENITAYAVAVWDKTNHKMSFITVIYNSKYAPKTLPNAEAIVNSVRYSATKPSDYTVIY